MTATAATTMGAGVRAPRGLRRWLGIPPADSSPPRWHVSPAIDTVAYHYSWLLALLPLLAMGEQHPVDYLALYVMVMTFTFVHRHFTLPYVYLDAQVFTRHRLRFIVFPALMTAAFLVSPTLWTVRGADGAFVHRGWMGGVALFAALWNVQHVYMQKFGILRLYEAKNRRAQERMVPAWVDRWLLFAWMPLYAVVMLPANRHLIERHARTVEGYLLPAIDFMEASRLWVTLPATLLVVASIVCFVVYEWRVHRLSNVPRLSMALGMTGLSAAFLVFHPIKVYMAFAFSHAVEYMVFVWAFQRRRYAGELPHRPLLGRLLQRPLLAYATFILVVGGGYVLGKHVGYSIAKGVTPLEIAGATTGRWLFFWGIYQSMMHFYFDGFLWKMRLPAVRQHL